MTITGENWMTLDTGHAPKTVYVYPLGRHVPQRLCTAPAPGRGAPAGAPDGP
jgi:hypothetical protein